MHDLNLARKMHVLNQSKFSQRKLDHSQQRRWCSTSTCWSTSSRCRRKPRRLRAFRSIDLNVLAWVLWGMSGFHHSSSFISCLALSLRWLISVGLATSLGKAGGFRQCFWALSTSKSPSGAREAKAIEAWRLACCWFWLWSLFFAPILALSQVTYDKGATTTSRGAGQTSCCRSFTT